MLVNRLRAGLRILLGIGALFLATLVAYLITPAKGEILLDCCKTIFPPIATLIIAFYFKDKA